MIRKIVEAAITIALQRLQHFVRVSVVYSNLGRTIKMIEGFIVVRFPVHSKFGSLISKPIVPCEFSLSLSKLRVRGFLFAGSFTAFSTSVDSCFRAASASSLVGCVCVVCAAGEVGAELLLL